MKNLLDFINESADRAYANASDRKYSLNWVSDLVAKMKGNLKRKTGRAKPKIAFYVDNSGSINGSIKNIYKGIYSAAEQINARNTVDFEISTFAFKVERMKWGSTPRYGEGGTINLDILLDYIEDNTANYALNVIVTDMIGLAKELDNYDFEDNVVVVCNVDNQYLIKELRKAHIDLVDVDIDFYSKKNSRNWGKRK